MLIASIVPPIDYFFTKAIMRLERFIDRGCTDDRFRTKQTSLEDYVDLYSGPQYKIENELVDLLLFISIGLMYGTAIPILYFILCFCFLSLWVANRLNLCYLCKTPPAYDH